LFTIANRRLIEQWPKQARQRTGPAAPEWLDHPAPAHGQDDPSTLVIEHMSAQDAVDVVVATLTRGQADVVLLRIVAGFDAAEVAEIMGRSERSVRVLCHQARRRLGATFPEEGARARRPDHTPTRRVSRSADRALT